MTVKRLYRKILFPSLALASAAMVLAACSEDTQNDAKELAVIKQAPEFSAVNYDGTRLTNEMLAGDVWIASFMFSSCSGPCPVLSQRLSEMQDFCREAGDVKFVSFTVDPENDTEEVLGRYAERYQADSDMWYFLRMPQQEVAELSVKGFYLGNIDDPTMHSTRFCLVDKQGNIRGYFDGMDAEALERLRSAVKLLAAQEA